MPHVQVSLFCSVGSLTRQRYTHAAKRQHFCGRVNSETEIDFSFGSASSRATWHCPRQCCGVLIDSLLSGLIIPHRCLKWFVSVGNV